MNRLADLMAAQTQRSGLEIEIDKIAADPDQPRRRWDDTRLRSLADSIAARGVVQPVGVCRDWSAPGRFILVAGERRWRAAQLAGLARVPAIVREIAGDERLALQLVENLDREDLHVLDEARAIQRLAKTYALRGRDIARLLGKPESWVSQRRKLAEHAGILEVVVDAGATQDVETLTQLADLHQQDRARFDALVARGRVSRQDARRALQQAREGTADGAGDAASPRRRSRTCRETVQEPQEAVPEPSATQPDRPTGTTATAGRSGVAGGFSDAVLNALADADVRIDARGRLRISLPGGRCVEVALDADQVRTISEGVSSRRA